MLFAAQIDDHKSDPHCDRQQDQAHRHSAAKFTFARFQRHGSGQGARVTYTYRVFRPLTAYFIKTSDGPSFAAYFTISPIEELSCQGWMWLAMNYGHDVPAEEIRDFESEVTAQDVPIVESQRPELLPLDLQAELHLRSDRTAIAYRKWLKQLGLTFGTA